MVVGTMIIQMLMNLKSFWDIPDSAEGMMIGIILLAGITVDELLRRHDGPGSRGLAGEREGRVGAGEEDRCQNGLGTYGFLFSVWADESISGSI